MLLSQILEDKAPEPILEGVHGAMFMLPQHHEAKAEHDRKAKHYAEQHEVVNKWPAKTEKAKAARTALASELKILSAHHEGASAAHGRAIDHYNNPEGN
jgi:hypothetical protein